MALEAHIDTLNALEIAGWVYDNQREDEPVSVEILSGDEVLATLSADIFRPDLLDAGKGNGRHAFHYKRDPPPDGAPPLSVRIAGKRWRIQHNAPGRPAAIYHDPRRIYLHTLEFGYPQAPHGFTNGVPSPDEEAITTRLIKAFNRSVKDNPAGRSREADIWSEIDSIYHREVLELIRRHDVAGLAAYLREAHAKGITFGITQGIETTAALRERPEARRAVLTQFVDNLVSFAEYLGLLDVESPAQLGQFAENIHSDPQALVDRIAATLGFPIETPPVIGSYFGIQTRGGILTGRDLCSLYAALRMRDIAADAGLASPKIYEIGGGLGGVAYYCARLGFNHTIVDLPLVSLLQGYFLLRALPGADIRLYGEGESPATAIRLLPTFCFARPGSEHDILLNQDSFPEMNSLYSLAYLQQARTSTRQALFSINQEGRAPQAGAAKQTVVRELVAQAGGFRCAARFRHWLRAGYVEEIYRPVSG